MEATTKNTLKLCLESKAPLTPVQPQKQPLASMMLLQHSPTPAAGQGPGMEGWSCCAYAQVSLAGAPPGITAQSTPLLAQPWSIVCTS